MNAALLFVLILFQQGLWVAGSDVHFEITSADGQPAPAGLVAQWVLSMNKTVVASGTESIDAKTGKALVKLKAPQTRTGISLKLEYRVRAAGEAQTDKAPLSQGSASIWVAPEPDLEFAGRRLPARSVMTVGGDSGLDQWLTGKSVPAVAMSQKKADDKPRVVIARARDVDKDTGAKLLEAARSGAIVLVYGQPSSDAGELLGIPLVPPGKTARIVNPANPGPLYLDIPPVPLAAAFEKTPLALDISAAASAWTVLSHLPNDKQASNRAVSVTKPVGQGWVCIALSTQDDIKQHPVLQTLVKNTLSLAIDPRPLHAASNPRPERPTP